MILWEGEDIKLVDKTQEGTQTFQEPLYFVQLTPVTLSSWVSRPIYQKMLDCYHVSNTETHKATEWCCLVTEPWGDTRDGSEIWRSRWVKLQWSELFLILAWMPPPPSHLSSPSIRWPSARPGTSCTPRTPATGGRTRSWGRRTRRPSGRPCTDRSSCTAPGCSTRCGPSCRSWRRWPAGRARRRPRRAPGWCTATAPPPAAAPGPACPAAWWRRGRGWGARRARPRRARSGWSPRTCWPRWWPTARRRTRSAGCGWSPRSSGGTSACSSSPAEAGEVGVASLSLSLALSPPPITLFFLPNRAGALPAANSWRKNKQMWGKETTQRKGPGWGLTMNPPPSKVGFQKKGWTLCSFHSPGILKWKSFLYVSSFPFPLLDVCWGAGSQRERERGRPVIWSLHLLLFLLCCYADPPPELYVNK